MSQSLQEQFKAMMTQVAADTAAQTTVVNSVQTAINGLQAQYATAIQAAAANGATPEMLAALTAVDENVKSNNAALAAAVASGTLAATEPPAPATPPTPAPPITDPATGTTTDAVQPAPVEPVDPATGLPTT